MAIAPEIIDFVTEHAEAVVSEAKTILETSLGKDVDISFAGASDFDFEALSSDYAESVVDVSFVLASDPDGLIELFIDKKTAAKVGSIMMMVEEDEPEFNAEEHIDAMKETVNQIIGSIATNMSESLGFSVSFDNLKAEEAELSEENFSLPDLLSSKFTLSIDGGDPATIYSVMTASTVQAAMGEGAADEATEAEEDEEAAGEEAEEDAAGDEGDEETTDADLSEDELGDISEALGVDMDDEDDEGEGGGDVDIDSMLGGSPGDDVEVEEGGAPAQKSAAAPPEADDKLQFLMDLKFPVSIELGRTKMLIKDILDLGHGSVIEFDKLANEPVDLLIDDKKVAEGEVVVIDEHFGIRVTNLVQRSEFLKSVGRAE